MKESITYELMKFNNHVKENFDWLDFQVTLLDFTRMNIIDEIDSNILPSLRENCFYLRFNNTDLDTPSFIIMAENIVISYEKKYFNQL